MSNKGVDSVIEEMFPGVRMRNRKAEPAAPAPAEAPAKPEVATTPETKPERKRRRRPAEPKTEGILDANMYSIALVGGVVMPGYPLHPGEKLVIAKLTPLVIER